ncbi:MAG: DUF4249 family protein [Bacteroidales bacterium]|nr:DUF4249 family protein [Bacteroidales bacterium]
MRPFIFLILSLLLLSISCNNDNILTADTNQVVVQAFLNVGDSVAIKVTRQFVFDSADSTYEPISGLDIFISDDKASYKLTSKGEGKYSSSLITKEGKTYTLSFVYNNKRISATCKAPTKPENFNSTTNYFYIHKTYIADSMSILTLKWNNPDSNYYFVSIYFTDPSLNPIDSYFGSSRTKNFEPSQTDSLRLTERTFRNYGWHRIVLFHINKEYSELFKRYSSNSESLTNPPTNIMNGLGIFTAFATDTLWVRVMSK